MSRDCICEDDATICLVHVEEVADLAERLEDSKNSAGSDRAANLMKMLKLSEGKVRRVIEH